MTEAWDLRSNIKAKKGSQGTLFQPADKDKTLNPTLRYPRGYTPGRLNEVRKGLQSTYVEPPAHTMTDHNHGWDTTPQHSGVKQYEPGDYSGELGYKETHVIPSIARSTIPVMHLEGLKTIGAKPDAGTQGTYYPGRGTLAVDMTDNDAGPDDAGQTMIHELGHHYYETNPFGKHAANDKIIEAGTAHARQQKEMRRAKQPFLDPQPNKTEVIEGAREVQVGVHEGLADNYLVKHYRTPGRRPQTIDKGAYETGHSEVSLQQGKYKGYRDVRPRELPTTMARNSSNVQFGRRDLSLPGMSEPEMFRKRPKQQYDEHDEWPVR